MGLAETITEAMKRKCQRSEGVRARLAGWTWAGQALRIATFMGVSGGEPMRSEVREVGTGAGALRVSEPLRCWAKSRLPRCVWNFLSYAKRAWRYCVGSLYYVRAQRILRAYGMHYAQAQ